MNIRLATEEDLNSIIDICLKAFPDSENQQIVELAKGLLSEEINPPIKSFVAEVDNKVVGYVSFSPILTNLEVSISGYILAPLGVLPDYQNKGVGSALINEGKNHFSKYGIDVLLVYGDPEYYGKFGFNDKDSQPFIPPYELKYPFGWLGLSLTKKELKNHSINFKCPSPLMKPSLW